MIATNHFVIINHWLVCVHRSVALLLIPFKTFAAADSTSLFTCIRLSVVCQLFIFFNENSRKFYRKKNILSNKTKHYKIKTKILRDKGEKKHLYSYSHRI